MNKPPDLIPLTSLDQSRDNPMIWDGEEAAQGVFLDAGGDSDPNLTSLLTRAERRAELELLRARVHPDAEQRRQVHERYEQHERCIVVCERRKERSIGRFYSAPELAPEVHFPGQSATEVILVE